MTAPRPATPTPESTPESRPESRAPERRARTRGHLHRGWDVIFRLLRLIARHVHGFYTTVGLFLVIGTSLAVVGIWGFAKVASHVRRGATQHFDDTVLRYIATNHSPVVESVMLEITFLGTATVVLMVVAVAALFLWLTRHRHSAVLLLVSTAGGLLLNWILKASFDRPRPQLFTWGTHVVSSSFPSGHAMSATVVYGTVAYLAARLQRTRGARLATLAAAVVVILLICVSRLYLGVHYPSDVVAGVLMGFAWAGFCMATLEAMLLLARRAAPEAARQELPPSREPVPTRDVPVRET